MHLLGMYLETPLGIHSEHYYQVVKGHVTTPNVSSGLRSSGRARNIRLCMKMKNLLVFAMLLAYGAVMTQGSFWDLQKMIKQVTMKCAFWNYYNYGCHCGLGGKGTPKDGTDQCCYLHDCCYERLKNHGCNAKFNSYSYVYLNGKIYCGMGSQCKRESCQCDGDFVLCLKKHLSSYKKGYRFYRKKHCADEKPTC
ncbi:basic phospholipase A2 sphenotoxin subunit B isoform X1 [Chelonia mydas]|uniref:basic phospholipase A2 sphenotoxin subunit B isoform X1 n=2 Tax=Chelonia mydas TaxID=8469 RepID=UPI001CA84CF8|nr:basic phospholipase A2 sphenotoxin subunit B isoform X1 [Chelonia mydas]